jgi:hypothetical protein
MGRLKYSVVGLNPPLIKLGSVKFHLTRRTEADSVHVWSSFCFDEEGRFLLSYHRARV